MKLSVKGFEIHSGFLDVGRQRAVLNAVRAVVAQAPFVRPDTPNGKAMSVRMTAAGTYGWYSDKKGLSLYPEAPERNAVASDPC